MSPHVVIPRSWMKFVFDDWLSSRVRNEAIRTDNPGLIGTYIDLLVQMAKGVPVPMDSEALRGITAGTKEQIEKNVEALLRIGAAAASRGGFYAEDGFLHNRRVEEEYAQYSKHVRAEQAKRPSRAHTRERARR